MGTDGRCGRGGRVEDALLAAPLASAKEKAWLPGKRGDEGSVGDVAEVGDDTSTWDLPARLSCDVDPILGWC